MTLMDNARSALYTSMKERTAWSAWTYSRMFIFISSIYDNKEDSKLTISES